MTTNTIYEKKYVNPFFFTHNKEFGGSKEDYHFHDNYEIYLFLTPKGKSEISKKEYQLEFGDILIINNQDIHKFTIDPNILYDRYTIMFTPEFIKGISTEHSDILGAFKYRDQNFIHKVSREEYQDFFSLEDLLQNMEEIKEALLIENNFEKEILSKIEFSKLLLKINKIFNNRSVKISNEEKVDLIEGREKIEEILKYINRNLSEDLSLDRISKEFYMNKYYLSHFFKKNFGTPLGRYITGKRIDISKKLLLKGINIYEVIEESGFNSYSHFLKTFKIHTGLTTKEFLKKNGTTS